MGNVFNVFRLEVTFSGGGGANKQHVTTKNTAKLDRETEELKHDKVPLDLGKLIQQGRQAKGMSQKDLATVRFEARRDSSCTNRWETYAEWRP